MGLGVLAHSLAGHYFGHIPPGRAHRQLSSHTSLLIPETAPSPHQFWSPLLLLVLRSPFLIFFVNSPFLKKLTSIYPFGACHLFPGTTLTDTTASISTISACHLYYYYLSTYYYLLIVFNSTNLYFNMLIICLLLLLLITLLISKSQVCSASYIFPDPH